MNDIQHYVMHAYYIYIYMSIIRKETIFIYIGIYEEYTALCYACIYYIYIYMSIITKETIFIYISIYEEYTALCYACIYYIYMSILCLKMAIYHAFRLMHLDS